MVSDTSVVVDQEMAIVEVVMALAVAADLVHIVD
jgi:hypothetical protein